MDYEKAYNKALERAKKWYNAPNADKIPTYANRIIVELFPELKESEDEKIRKMIINHLTQERGSLSNDEAAEAIAWLEKQGEQKPSWSDEDEKMLQYVAETCQYNRIEVVEWLKSLKERLS